jgi:hypothetical protein
MFDIEKHSNLGNRKVSSAGQDFINLLMRNNMEADC